MNQVRALINPRILKWARDSIGYSEKEAADKIFGKKSKSGSEKLKNCEAGKDYLTFNQFEKAVNTYKRPIEVFYLPEVPKDPTQLPDFRGLDKSKYKKYPKLEYQIRRIKELRHNFKILNQEKYFDWNFISSIKQHENSEQVAVKLKEALQISNEELLQWKKDQLLKNLIQKIENLGIIVFKIPNIPSEIFGGFCIVEESFPVIVLNNQDYESRKIFTLIHELTHIFLGKSAICMPFELFGAQIDPIEIFCNYVAGAFLVPEEIFLSHNLVRNHKALAIWTPNELETLSKYFHVSEEEILRRLLVFKKILTQKKSDKYEF